MGGILGVGFKLPVEDRGRVAALLAIEGLLAFWFLGDLAFIRRFVQDGHHSNLTLAGGGQVKDTVLAFPARGLRGWR